MLRSILPLGFGAALALSILCPGAFADAFDWSAAKICSGPLQLEDGTEARYRSGSIPFGEHQAIAVEITWHPRGLSQRSEEILYEMADSPAVVSTHQGMIIATWSVLPFGAEQSIEVERCWRLADSEPFLDVTECPSQD